MVIHVVGFHCGHKPPDVPWSRDHIFSGEGRMGGTGTRHIRRTIYFAGTPEYALRYCGYAYKQDLQAYLYTCLLTLRWTQLQPEPFSYDKAQREFTVEDPTDIQTLDVVAISGDESGPQLEALDDEKWDLALDVYRQISERKLQALSATKLNQMERALQWVQATDNTAYPVCEPLRIAGMEMVKGALYLRTSRWQPSPAPGGDMVEFMHSEASRYSPFIEYGKRLAKALEESGNKVPKYVREAALNIVPGVPLFDYVYSCLEDGFARAGVVYDAEARDWRNRR